MNTKRKVLISIYAIIIFVLCVVVVPKKFYRIETDEFLGYQYGLLWDNTFYTGSIFDKVLANSKYFIIDYERIGLQIAGVTVLFVPLFLFTDDKKRITNP